MKLVLQHKHFLFKYNQVLAINVDYSQNTTFQCLSKIMTAHNQTQWSRTQSVGHWPCTTYLF